MSNKSRSQASQLRGMSGMSLMQADRVSRGSKGGAPVWKVLLATAAFVAVGGGTWYGLQLTRTAPVVQVVSAQPRPITRPEIEVVATTPATQPVAAPAAIEPEPQTASQQAAPTPQPAASSIVQRVAATSIIAPKAAAPAPRRDCIATLMRMAQDLTIPFSIGDAQVTEDGLIVARTMGQAAERCPEAQIMITGHSDSSGDDTLNLQLSWQRADAVLAALTGLGYDARQFDAVGFGARYPTEQGDGGNDPMDRRVEFRVLRSTEVSQ